MKIVKLIQQLDYHFNAFLVDQRKTLQDQPLKFCSYAFSVPTLKTFNKQQRIFELIATM